MIWTFQSNEAKNTDDVNLAQYKMTGKFYEDAEALFNLLGVQIHPALRPVLWEVEKKVEFVEQEENKEPEPEPITVVKFDKHRIDKNTMKVLFHMLPTSQVKTLKFTNNGISPSQFDALISNLNQTPTIQTVFFDWNPLYKEDFRGLDNKEEWLYQRPEEEESKFVKFVAPESKIKILFLRGNGLTDDDSKQI